MTDGAQAMSLGSDASGPEPGSTSAALRRMLRRDRLQATGVKLGAVLLVVWAWLTIDNFGSASNLRAIMYSVSAIGIAAVGMSLITLSGNLFMLSMAATAAVSTIVFAALLHLGLPITVLLVVMVGALIGGVQGVIVGIAGANPIVATIAVSSIVMGMGALYSGGLTIVGQGDASFLGVGQVGSLVPNQLLLFLGVAVALEIVVERTRFGRELKLIGMNRQAAELAGLRLGRTLVIAFVLAGAAAALSGALFASQASQGNLRLGTGLDFDAIAAVLVGGVSIRGGRGRVIDAAVGALFLAIISNVLLVKGLAFEVQLVVKGLVVVVSVIIGALALGFRRT